VNVDALFLTLVAVVVFGLVFDYVNGFHDAANAIATVVSTGVLPLRTAVLLAAVLNFVGAFAGTAVAKTIGADLLDAAVVTQVLVLSALIGAIVWNLITWWFGLPSSSSHALVGGILGAGIARAGFAAVKAAGIEKVLKAMIFSPLAGFLAGFVVMVALTWIVRRGRPARVNRGFRWLQMLSSTFMAFSHGTNDAQKVMGILTMALVSYGIVPKDPDGFHVPLWVVVSCATAMGLGTAAGGVRIIKTMGTKIIELRPIHGFAAETSAAVTLLGAAALGMPSSTTHVISSSIMGVGASQRVSAVRWGVTARILWAWVLTIPASGLVAAACYAVLSRVLAP
jgi:inorganic phosphate transporter, PiT family